MKNKFKLIYTYLKTHIKNIIILLLLLIIAVMARPLEQNKSNKDKIVTYQYQSFNLVSKMIGEIRFLSDKSYDIQSTKLKDIEIALYFLDSPIKEDLIDMIKNMQTVIELESNMPESKKYYIDKIYEGLSSISDLIYMPYYFVEMDEEKMERMMELIEQTNNNCEVLITSFGKNN